VFNHMLSFPIIKRPSAIIIIPSIGLGTTTLHKYFDKGGELELIEDIVSLKERPQTSTSEGDWRRMNPSMDIRGMTAGAFNHIYQFNGDDIILPGADQDLQLRVFATVNPQPLIAADSPLIPSTPIIIEMWASGLICNVRGSARLASVYMGTPGNRNGLAQIEEDALFNKIVQQLQETPFRQKSFSGRVKAYL